MCLFTGLLRLVLAMGALLPLYADVVLHGLVLREVAGRLGLVVAMRALFPLYADVVFVGLVRRDVAVQLGLELAALVVIEPPEDINIVHVGSVLLDFAIPLSGRAAREFLSRLGRVRMGGR